MATTEPRYATIGQRIRAARLRAGISQEQLAPLVGTSRRHIVRLEGGHHLPGVELLGRIAAATGKPVGFFTDDASREQQESSEPGEEDELAILGGLVVRLIAKHALRGVT